MRNLAKALISVAATVAFVLPAGASGDSSVASPADCNLVAAPGGSDAATGTAAEPLRTADALVAALGSDQTGCFRGGTYSFSVINLREPGSTLTSFPGENATLQGQVRVERPATGATIAGLKLDGRNPTDEFSPLIYADDVDLADNEITNSHTSNCVHVAPYYDDPAPDHVIIEGNTIHDCGRIPASNHDHGIYIAASTNLVIRDNTIYNNADRGIQLFPDAQHSHIYGNVIDGNGEGILFSGYDGISSNNNIVENNLITNSNLRHNVESFYPEGTPAGTGNVVRNNCIYGADGWYEEADGSGIANPQEGFTASNNLIADPGYVNRAAHDYRLAPGSPCAGVLQGADPAVAVVTLETDKHQVPPGAHTTLTGTVPSGVAGRVWIVLKRHGHWRAAGHANVRGTTFHTRIRVTKDTRFKARAAGARDSKAVRVATLGQRKH